MHSIPWSYRLYRFAWSGIDLLFPPICGGCRKPGSRWCPVCQKRVPLMCKPFCEKCAIPEKTAGSCEQCKSNPPADRVMRSWAVFDSLIQHALHTLKYGRNMVLGEALASQMASFLRAMQWDIDTLIPVPLGEKRLKERGYNQVGLIARPLVYELGTQYVPYGLRKVRETRSQAGLNISQRKENVRKVNQAEAEVYVVAVARALSHHDLNRVLQRLLRC